MEVHPPAWYLNARCPCCDQGTQEFSTCPTCGLVVLICGEIGEVFGISGRQCGPIIGSIDNEQTCQSCSTSAYFDFRRSTSEEIRALGFRWPEDYN